MDEVLKSRHFVHLPNICDWCDIFWLVWIWSMTIESCNNGFNWFMRIDNSLPIMSNDLLACKIITFQYDYKSQLQLNSIQFTILNLAFPCKLQNNYGTLSNLRWICSYLPLWVYVDHFFIFALEFNSCFHAMNLNHFSISLILSIEQNQLARWLNLHLSIFRLFILLGFSTFLSRFFPIG